MFDTLGKLGQSLDLVSTMITLVIAGVVGFVGINVMSNTREQTALQENDSFYNASEDLTSAISDTWSQLGTVFTVIVLVVIVSYLVVLRGR
jgi:uncharacterized membrane protein